MALMRPVFCTQCSSKTSCLNGSLIENLAVSQTPVVFKHPDLKSHPNIFNMRPMSLVYCTSPQAPHCRCPCIHSCVRCMVSSTNP
ncbi:unnamed protein product [Macrosiphum euphorbiae]|uniref:Uncharacterized protein n=1 Tax=Macrosiphum euphorbiae TaxID=13131 RepID=A0AAV0WN38_9HEMI|nr:unnamed protein product [Macrosiphum euphorbiae]